MLRSLLCVPLVVALALFALPARAEDDATIEDVVLLSDGSFVRGTLVEYAAGEYAVLLTRAGLLRRFEATEVSYVGPARTMPQPAAIVGGIAAPVVPSLSSAVSVPPRPSPPPAVYFESSQRLEVLRRSGVSVTLSGVTAGESYTPLCTAPCSARLAPGSYTLALALPGERVPLRAGTFDILGSATFDARYESRLGLRVGGFVIAFGSTAAGLALMLTDTQDLGGSFWTGCALSTLGTIVGTVLALTPDRAHLRVR